MRDTKHENRLPETSETARASSDAGNEDGGDWPGELKLPELSDAQRAEAKAEERAGNKDSETSERDEPEVRRESASGDASERSDSERGGEGDDGAWPDDARLPELDPAEREQVQRSLRDQES